MNRAYTPGQIATRLDISTTTLRRYEKENLIPDVPRTASNHRYYTPIHLQAFVAIRLLLKGYEIPVVYEVMRKVRQGNTMDALWLMNQQLYNSQLEKERMEDIWNMVQQVDFANDIKGGTLDTMTIGKAAEAAGVNTSAIRHWESEGLICSERDPDNGYRMYTRAELRKILVISSLRKSVYNIEHMKELLNTVGTQDYTQINKAFQLALQKLNSQLTLQFAGVKELMTYIELHQEPQD
ncbi:MerR family transcriptional regulator [Paenibacillus sp. BIC5C1]|uniref:MerR family transcriptional regulator n=1 Tax=Paenibacillus sp. BIC5C1 TaxID=3078263 RepID=UPI0028EF6F16|nr:MerR family transcriptional regulator [Paenibacillus sp. BIC5C1]